MPTKKAEPSQPKKAPPKAKPKTATPRAKRTPKPKQPVGRPTLYTEELCDRICAELSAGISMRSVSKAEDMPSAVTMFAWMRKYPEFLKRYEAAKAEAADAMIEEMLDIADDGTNDWMEIHDKEGECVGYKVNGEHVQRSRLRVDTRKWIAAKLKPKKYGDKVDVSHGVQEDNPLAQMMAQLAGRTLKPVAENE